MTSRADLIAELEKAPGPSRDLDFEIHCLGKPGHAPPMRMILTMDRVPTYTDSVDVALTLVPELWRKDIWIKRRSGHHWTVTLHQPSIEREGWHKHLPNALCIAALKAGEA